MYCWIADCSSVLKFALPVVESKISALYGASAAALVSGLVGSEAAGRAGSKTSTLKPLAAPSCWMATIESGMWLCRKPCVRETIRTLYAAFGFAAIAVGLTAAGCVGVGAGSDVMPPLLIERVPSAAVASVKVSV